jgi:chromosome segregation ATPase
MKSHTKHIALMQPSGEPEPPQKSKAAKSKLAQPLPAKKDGTQFQISIQVGEEEMSGWATERLTAFLDAVTVLLMAKTRAKLRGQVKREQADPDLRAELRQLEARVAARLQEHEEAVARIEHTASDALDTLRGQLSAVEAQSGAAPERAAAADPSLEAVQERIDTIEQAVDGVRQHVTSLHENVAEDFRAFEENLAAHSNAIQSARSAMSQTDDLVERVVEALESLQSSALQASEHQAVAVG